MKELVKERVAEAVRKVYGEDAVAVLERASFEKPKRKEFGDLATNVAFLLAKVLRQSPRSIAQEIVRVLRGSRDFESVEVAGGGFINFKLSQSLYEEILKAVVETDFYLSDVGRGERVLLEYVSANPTGPLHVGHGRGAVVGDVLYRVMKLTGYRPEREFYINDAGRQIKLLGLSLYAKAAELEAEKIKKTLALLRSYLHPIADNEGRLLEPIPRGNLIKQIKFFEFKLQKLSSVKFPEDGYKGDYIKEIAAKLLENEPDLLDMPEEEAIYLAAAFGKTEFLRRIKEDLRELRVEFDHWFSERELYEKGEVERAVSYTHLTLPTKA